MWRNIHSDPRSSMKQTHENTQMTIKYLEDFNIKNYLSTFLDNNFLQLFSHSPAYLFTNFVKSNPWRLTVPWHKVLPKSCQLGTSFHRCNYVPLQRRWYSCWPVVPAASITWHNWFVLIGWPSAAAQTAMTQLKFIWN